MPTSPTLLAYSKKELESSGSGSYFNSDILKKEVTETVLRWQRIPENLWPHFQLLLPSDAGTGAVQTAIQVACLLNPAFKTLSVEALGWPAYKVLATSARLGFQEYDSDGVASGDNVLPLYQAGPMNTTGRVPTIEIVQRRASAAQQSKTPVILDRAYSGFEYARQLEKSSYADIMRKSYQNQIEPFLKAGVPVAIAISPTKAFVTFSLRPCGLLLVFTPDLQQSKAVAPKLSGLIRARGSSFEHPISRAFVKGLVHDWPKFQAEHSQALKRCADAERLWQRLSKGTAIESLFSDQYAGLFRNPKAKPDAMRAIYGEHIYPVFADGRCRLNVTGLPTNEKTAAHAVSFFSKYCYL